MLRLYADYAQPPHLFACSLPVITQQLFRDCVQLVTDWPSRKGIVAVDPGINNLVSLVRATNGFDYDDKDDEMNATAQAPSRLTNNGRYSLRLHHPVSRLHPSPPIPCPSTRNLGRLP
ncbi:hypothetical protein SeMB42_g01325 [Synchytrium endobioticum]|uniref:Uncharacterized protein n=1 Tax=Synchytrium endobioticum TaxID=286115 RepID=A0A507DME0_9FUNG|nr:hypothetical protein SeMB42_g01325 [Synchytrium endobioticum]